MKEKWNVSKVIGLLLGIVSLICIMISIFQEGNNILLWVGIVCNSISLVLFMLMNKK